MNWQNLKRMKCPQCNKALFESYGAKGYTCECSFFITRQKFNTVVSGLYNPQQRGAREQTEEERMSEFNNLGHKPVTEDFEDSPHADRQAVDNEEDI